ncbi:MAG: magnesium-protoporphyrin IX monomethyl ester anaerobic oxidative cyclase [Hyphomicrobiaceae bacterium]
MKILIVNPPHKAIGSRMPGEMLPPLGLLAIGGPLICDGHDVSLLDADVADMTPDAIVEAVVAKAPDALLLGHNGSTSAHPTIVDLMKRLRPLIPETWFIYGGVFPTYHWRECLDEMPELDIIVRGEGEETTRRLICAIEDDTPLEEIAGLAFRRLGLAHATPPAPMIRNLDDYRVGWELIDHARYSYYGGKRGVVVQFSRGCPHLCSYCGQRGYWTRWRHRDPKAFAAELGRLYREHGVTMISFADENPTTSKKVWRELLKEIIAQNCKFTMIATLRASDIVRDADILHLYRKAGFERFLIGMEHSDPETLAMVRKGSVTKDDREAIRLLRRHGILSLCTTVFGFNEERDRDYLRIFRQLLVYDPDQIITLFVTPHRWTPFFVQEKDRKVIQTDQRFWDYKHQVLANRHVPAWRSFLWVKLIEVLVQTRPKALFRTYLHPDPAARHGMRWYSRIGRKVWLHEIWEFLTAVRFSPRGPSLEAFWGGPQRGLEDALSIRKDIGRSGASPSHPLSGDRTAA